MTRSHEGTPAKMRGAFYGTPPLARGILPVLLTAFIGLSGTAHAQTDPLLGSASNFAVLAGSWVSNTGISFIQGNVGVNPGTAMTGFSSVTQTNGAIHSADAVAQLAQADVNTAYITLQNRAFTTDLTGQDLGSRTLTAGVYHFSSSAQLTGPLVLDAQGDASAQFVFQMGSTLTTAAGSSVRLINGGDARNVYWQVGTSATLGTDSTLSGSILADASITANSGAVLDFGRLLARSGAVTLDSNRVSSSIVGAAVAPEPSSAALLVVLALPLAGRVLRRRTPRQTLI